MTDPSFYVPLAQAAEEAGFTSMVIPDSVMYPKESDSTYPYTPDGNREFLEDKAFFEPFSLIPTLGMVTKNLRFTTFVLKLPIRPPVLVAKQASSTAVLTNNRLSLGVGVSPWPEDFEFLDVEWKGRGKRMDECIDVIRGLCDPDGEFFEYHGEHIDIAPVKICPVPAVPIPILIGGHAEVALRRAAYRGDGWMHAGGDPEELKRLIARLKEILADNGREDDEFEIHVISMDAYTPEGIERLQEIGVTDAIVGFHYPYHRGPDPEPLERKLEAIERFSDSVIAKVR